MCTRKKINMTKQIKLNKDVSIDLEKLIEGGMVILANSGGGKSYLIRRIAEQAVKNVQVIIIDPEGEFASLREKFDFILAGKNADVPAEPRSAELLALKLLELNKSAVIDLYELHPQERQRFVKLFCEALVNCPKELYHPVLIILDEAHEYVPEGKPSEATWAVESLASKGRKRGQRLILASQRISKLSKNAAAECNNKLIGRTSQDIDMKRAGDELGFSKEKLVSLRKLKAGEFFAFGAAISDDVIQLKIGDVETSHAKVSYKGDVKIPPPSSVIKKVLAEIKDLPKEAEKEARTNKELKQSLMLASQTIMRLEKSPKIDEKAIAAAVAPYKKDLELMTKAYENNVTFIKDVEKAFGDIFSIVDAFRSKGKKIHINKIPLRYSTTKERPVVEELLISNFPIAKETIREHFPKSTSLPENQTVGKCGRMIYSYLATKQGQPMNKTQVAVATGYSQNSGGFNNAISELSSAGLIERNAGALWIVGVLDEDLLVEVDPSLQKWSPKLGACARKIWDLMLNHHIEECWSKEQIANETGYSVTSGGFNNSISELSSLGLIERLPQAQMRINPELYNL